MNEATHIQNSIQQGRSAVSDEFLRQVYADLRRLASWKLSHEEPGQTLQPTALVHETYLRLVQANRCVKWDNRGHFFVAAAEAMRRILIDRARRKRTMKHGVSRQRAPLSEFEPSDQMAAIDLLELNDALDQLEKAHPRKAEVVKLRFFGGLTVPETAEAVGASCSTVDNDWAYAKAWLRAVMQ